MSSFSKTMLIYSNKTVFHFVLHDVHDEEKKARTTLGSGYCIAVVQLDVNSRVQHPDALFLHPVALFFSCLAPCPFCLTVPFINVGLLLEQPVLHQHGPYLILYLTEKCHGQSVLHGYVELSL